MNSDKSVDFEKGDWTNFRSRHFVKESIGQTFPDSNWEDPSWGILDNNKAIIEFNIGDKEEMDNTFMLHVRGGQDPTGQIAKMCNQHNWIAFDIAGEQFIDNYQPTSSSFKVWENYRNQVILGSTKKKAWWKFLCGKTMLLTCGLAIWRGRIYSQLFVCYHLQFRLDFYY